MATHTTRAATAPQTGPDTRLLEKIVAEDRKLEQRAEGQARELMAHRWHWTLDESNPARMSLRGYAEMVGKSYTVIANHANGFALLRADRAGAISPSEAMERANMGAETEAATQAVAQAHNLSFHYTRQERAAEVRRVRELARQRAEQRGTTVAQEAPGVADLLARSDRAARREHGERRKRLGLRYIEVENEVDKARKHLLKAARVAEGLDFEAEHRDLLAYSLDTVRRLLDMMDRAIVGDFSPDWGDELRVIEGGKAS